MNEADIITDEVVKFPAVVTSCRVPTDPPPPPPVVTATPFRNSEPVMSVDPDI